MEQQRFEELTRGLATARSRRDIVKAFLGTLLAGGAVAAQRGGALAQDVPCTSDDDCDTGICCAGFCRDIECCIDDADPNARCPEGTSCFEGVCDPIEEPATCASDEECAEGEICCAGACRAIECCIDDADPNARCPEGTSCFEGVCDPIDGPPPCSTDDECGESEICCVGGCLAIECCPDEADPNARCPEGTACFEGYCDPVVDGGKPDDGTSGTSQPPVVALPSTGSGSTPGGGSSRLGAILAGGAAIAAGLGIRARRSRSAEADDE